MPGLSLIDRALLDDVSAEARSAPRRRKNRNLHAMEDPVHRLLNAVEPGTYIRPHRHADKSETALCVAGRIGLVVFDADGAVRATHVLDAAGPVLGADLAAGTWHTFVALAPGSVFFEAKPGPYAPPSASEVAAWAPAEGEPGAEELERRLRELFA